VKSEIEHWKDIPEYEGLYQVSNLGRVKNLKFGRDKILKPQESTWRYMQVGLCKEGKRKYSYVHRIVMLAFVGESDLQVNHKNGLKADNCLENLEYCTASENITHAYKNGLKKGLKGEKHGRSKLTKACVERIRYGHQGMMQKDIAKIYGITRWQVYRIRSRKNWKHI
jgi:hypothetical protein